MTQSLERPGPEATEFEGPRTTPTDPAEQSVRELLAELARLEDALRDGASVAEPTARAREQAILAELHRRSPQEDS